LLLPLRWLLLPPLLQQPLTTLLQPLQPLLQPLLLLLLTPL
jgi:hypothetical protein